MTRSLCSAFKVSIATPELEEPFEMKRLMIGTAALGLALGLNMAPAAAQNQTVDANCISPTVQVCQEEIRPAVLAETQTAPQQVAAAQASVGQTLPVTGGDVLGLAAVGAAAVAGGAALLAVRRRRSEA